MIENWIEHQLRRTEELHNILQEFESRELKGLIRSNSDANGLKVFCYTQKCVYERHWDLYTRKARGMVLDRNGKILCRPFEKFFNLGEMEETQPTALPTMNFTVDEKLDGSLLSVWYYNGQWRFTTKGSFANEQITYAEKIFPSWLLKSMIPGFTYLWEIVPPPTEDNYHRIVPHEAGAYFLTSFNNDTALEERTPPFDIERDRIFKCPTHQLTIEDCIKMAKDKTDIEGWVIRFDNGFRVKLKTDWYLDLFRLCKNVNEDSIKKQLLAGTFADWVVSVPEEFRKEVQNLADAITARFTSEEARLFEIFEANRDKDRKSFALSIKNDPNSFALFNMADGKDYREKLMMRI